MNAFRNLCLAGTIAAAAALAGWTRQRTACGSGDAARLVPLHCQGRVYLAQPVEQLSLARGDISHDEFFPSPRRMRAATDLSVTHGEIRLA